MSIPFVLPALPIKAQRCASFLLWEKCGEEGKKQLIVMET